MVPEVETKLIFQSSSSELQDFEVQKYEAAKMLPFQSKPFMHSCLAHRIITKNIVMKQLCHDDVCFCPKTLQNFFSEICNLTSQIQWNQQITTATKATLCDLC